MSPFFGLDGGAGWLESRADVSFGAQRNVNGSRGGLFQSATNETFNANQQMFLNEFRFAAAKSIRTSTIILATFNTIAAFATAVGILLDGYYRQKRNNRKFRFRRNGFTFVPEGEVYPLVLSFCIVVQGITFAAAQSTGLEKLVDTGCTMIGQLMLPAVFLAPYTQLVFGVEAAIRALRKKDQPFAPRAKWNVTICLAIIGILSLVNFLVANFDRAPNFCLTSLFWFVAHWSTGCFALLVGITCSLIISLVIIFLKLTRSIKIEVEARVAASRMVYYLALAIISNAFLIPFFFTIAFVDQRGGGEALQLSMVAAVVANVSGLVTGGLYLFLKSNTLSTIGPRDKVGEYERRKLKYKIRRADEPDPDADDALIRSLRRVETDEMSILGNEKDVEFRAYTRRPASSVYDNQIPDPLRSNAAFPMPAMPKAPEPVRYSRMSSVVNHMRKRSFSFFSSAASRKSSASSATLLPATTYSPNSAPQAISIADLKPPPSMRNLAAGRHRRDSSLVSSATVQIGLRLSSVEDMPPVTKSKIIVADTKVHHLECPKLREQERDSPLRSGRPAALQSPVSSPTGEDTLVDDLDDDVPRRDPVKDAKMKTLPPVPNLNESAIADDDDSDDDDYMTEKESEITLSPNVYNPQSPTKTKLPSPRGVGFSMPKPTKTSNDSGSPKAATAKSDWI
ncbi:hypothetical protein OQA88_1890 [Cercophora sp. LCS_1]